MFYRAVAPADGDPAAAVDRPTFQVLHDAVARALDGAPPERVLSAAVGLWGLVHGLVSLELAGLLPGDEGAREAAFDRAARPSGRRCSAGDALRGRTGPGSGAGTAAAPSARTRRPSPGPA